MWPRGAKAMDAASSFGLRAWPLTVRPPGYRKPGIITGLGVTRSGDPLFAALHRKWRVPDLPIARARAALACAEMKPAQLYMHSRARWIAPIGDKRREPVGEAIRSFDLGEQHHTAITGHASAVDGGGDGLENLGGAEAQSVCRRHRPPV
jgi:hypothetical protein